MTTWKASDWSIAQDKLKARWTNLTSDDLQFAEGKHDELLDRIQERTGEGRDVIENTISEVFPGWASSHTK